MTVREGYCRCGRLRVACTGAPVRVSVCHCLDCQRRSGSAFAAQARWPDDRVETTGTPREWSQRGDSGSLATFRFCNECGTTVSYVIEAMPGLTAIPIGIFADPDFPPPHYSVYESCKQCWVALVGDAIEHIG